MSLTLLEITALLAAGLLLAWVVRRRLAPGRFLAPVALAPGLAIPLAMVFC